MGEKRRNPVHDVLGRKALSRFCIAYGNELEEGYPPWDMARLANPPHLAQRTPQAHRDAAESMIVSYAH